MSGMSAGATAASKSAPECGATSAAHPDVPPGTNPAAVATTQRQKEAREKAAAEQLPERGSPVEVQQALPKEEAAREAGAEELPEQGGPVEVQLKLCQEGSWAEARRGQRRVEPEAGLAKIVLQPLIRGRRPQQHLEEDVATILGFSAPLYEVRQLSWRPAQVDQRASS